MFCYAVYILSLLHSVCFTCIYKSSFLRLHRQNFLKISVGLTLQNDDVSVFDAMINFYYRELPSKGMGLWDLLRISNCVGMTLRRVAVVDGGRERRLLKKVEKGWAHSSQRELSWQNVKRT